MESGDCISRNLQDKFLRLHINRQIKDDEGALKWKKNLIRERGTRIEALVAAIINIRLRFYPSKVVQACSI